MTSLHRITLLHLVLLIGCIFLASANLEHRAKRQTVNKPMQGVNLRVVSVESEPYLYKDSEGGFYGYIPDLLQELQERLGFEYTLTLPPDGRYGTEDNSGNWNGMIGQIILNERNSSDGFHIAAAPITITRQREAVVDFITPFAHVGLSAVIQKPEKRDGFRSLPWHFDFHVFKPLAPACWGVIFAALAAVWLFFWLMNAFNPYEFGQRHKRNMANEEQAELFTPAGSLWFAFTTLLWQGYDRTPRSIASKMMGCFWMIFATLTLVTYISSFLNYMFWASLSHPGLLPDVPRDLIDLVEQKGGYTYGTMKGGSTFTYLTQLAKATEYKKMALYWSTERGQIDLVDSTAQGIEKVRQSKYAFIGETMTLRHLVSSAPNCDLLDLGLMIGQRSYGFAIPNGFQYEDQINMVLLQMIELGDIDALEARWFDDGACRDTLLAEREAAAADAKSRVKIDRPQPVTLAMFWSPLTLLAVGVILSLLVGLGEVLWYKYRGRYDASNRPRGQQLANEDEGHI